MWTKLFFLLLLGASSLFAAPPNADLRQLKNYFENIKEEIIHSLYQMDEKRTESDQKLNEKFEELKEDQRKLATQISALNSSVLEQIKSNFEDHEQRVATRIENVLETIKVVELNIGQELKDLETNLTDFGQNTLGALNSSLDAGFVTIVDKIEEHDKNLNFRDVNAQEKMQKIIAKQNILEENIKYLKKIPNQCEKAKRLHLTSLGSSIYHFSTHSANWIAAKIFCHGYGMHLAHLDTQQEVTTVYNADRTTDYWVGASDVGHQPGQFYWENGLKVDDSLWVKAWGEPDYFGAGKEACVWLRAISGKLCDAPCANSRRFICELAQEDRHCLN